MDGNEKLPGTGRIEAFSDGVIAIIITIMILELKVPAESITHESFTGVVRELGPNLLVYALSFLIVAIMLLNHHSIMRVAGRCRPTGCTGGTPISSSGCR